MGVSADRLCQVAVERSTLAGGRVGDTLGDSQQQHTLEVIAHFC